MTSHAQPHAAHFDEHGHKDHGHTIVSVFTLRTVLALLLFFTLLTVGATMVEVWVAETFNVLIPQWVNVFVALSIAAVKTTIVVMFFMQLKYDNPLNTMIFVFTLLTVCFFLGFTALDLGNRGTLDRFKEGHIQRGGTGLGTGMPITQSAKVAAVANQTYDDHLAHHAHHGPRLPITEAGYVPKMPHAGSSAQKYNPVTGVTLEGLTDPAAAGEDEHGEGPAH
jgi:cytochrome c oxidase subunit 4